MPGASRVAFATVVKTWSAPTTWPAAVVTTRRKCTVVPGFSLRSLAVTGCGPDDGGKRLDGRAAQAGRRIAELERDLARRARRVDGRERASPRSS